MKENRQEGVQSIIDALKAANDVIRAQQSLLVEAREALKTASYYYNDMLREEESIIASALTKLKAATGDV